MRAIWIVLALGAFAFARTASGQVDAPAFDWSGAVPTGGTLRIDDVDGNIRVTGTSGSEVRVHGERTHVISGGRALVFQAVKTEDGVTVCAFHPSGRCDARGAHGGGGVQVSVSGQEPSADFTVELPAGVKLAASSGDGSIEVRDAGADVEASSGDGSIQVLGVAGDVKAHSGDGSITIERAKRAVTAHTGDGSVAISTVAGPVDASSGDGDVQLHLASTPKPGDITLHTGDGSVTVYLASQFGGQVDASTSDGSIESDMPLALSGRMDPQHLRGTIGSGGDVRLTIRTGDGNIRIRRE
jgi:Putative adhesin